MWNTVDVCGPLDPEGSFDKDGVTKRVEGGVHWRERREESASFGD